MDNLSDLILKAQKGDKDAYGKIYNLFYQRIYRYCSFNTRKAEVAEDICQETFLKAWKSLPSFSQKGGSFQAYIFKIARNLIIDASRKKKELPLVGIEIESNEHLEEKLEKQETAGKIKRALAKLKEDERQIIILRYFEDLSTREVAKAAGLKEGNLRVRLHRILKKLEGIIEND